MRLWILFVLLLSAGIARPEQIVVTVLATTDLHGNLYPIDYGTDRPAERGLAKIATLIRAAESENPDHILIACGDTSQGPPLEYVYQNLARPGAGPRGLNPPPGPGHEPVLQHDP